MEKDEGDSSMPIDPKSVSKMANEYTAAWNSKSAEAVASFYAEDGQIIINRGELWKGRSGIAEMASGFYADVSDLSLTCDAFRCAGTQSSFGGCWMNCEVNF